RPGRGPGLARGRWQPWLQRSEAGVSCSFLDRPGLGPAQTTIGRWAREHLMKRASRAPCSGSKPLRKTDRRTASQADRRVEQGIGRRAFSPCGERGVTMRAFVVAKLRNRAGQLGIIAVLLQLAQLARIVPVD